MKIASHLNQVQLWWKTFPSAVEKQYDGVGKTNRIGLNFTEVGVGPKSAQRIAFHLLAADSEDDVVRTGIVTPLDRKAQPYVRFELNDRVELAEGGDLAYDQLVWTGGIVGTGAMHDDRPVVRRDLRLSETTFVVGDAARVVDADGQAVPASAATAIREAATAAANISLLADHRLDPTSNFEPRLEAYRDDVPGWIVSVGDGAVAQLGPTVVRGGPAKAMKATVGAGHLSSVGAVKQAVDLVEQELNA